MYNIRHNKVIISYFFKLGDSSSKTGERQRERQGDGSLETGERQGDGSFV